MTPSEVLCSLVPRLLGRRADVADEAARRDDLHDFCVSVLTDDIHAAAFVALEPGQKAPVILAAEARPSYPLKDFVRSPSESFDLLIAAGASLEACQSVCLPADVCGDRVLWAGLVTIVALNGQVSPQRVFFCLWAGSQVEWLEEGLSLKVAAATLAAVLSCEGLEGAESRRRRLLLDPIQEHCPDGIVLLDGEGLVMSVNAAYRRLLRVDADASSIEGQPLRTRSEIRRAAIDEELSDILLRRKAFDADREMEGEPGAVGASTGAVGASTGAVGASTGGAAVLRFWGLPLKGGGDGPAVIVFVREVTRERALGSSVSRLEAAMLCSRDGMALAALDGRVVFANAAFARLFGHTLPSVKQTPDWAQLFSPASQARIGAECRPRVLSSGVWSGQLGIAGAEGADRPVDVVMTGLYDDDGNPNGVILDCREIVQAPSPPEEFRQAQKIEGISALAGGVAHDFRNLVTGILGFTEILKRTVEPDSPALRYLDIIERSAREAGELSNKLVELGRKAKGRLARCNLNELISGAVDSLRRELPPDVALRCELWRGDLWVEADALAFEKVLTELCRNASDAMRGRGAVTIRTFPTGGEKTGALEPLSAGGEAAAAVVSIEDQGSGVPEVRERGLESFRGARKPGREEGGLGLAAVQNIVRAHRGSMRIDSREGGGTAVSIILPLVVEKRAPIPARPPAPARETVRREVVVAPQKPAERIAEEPRIAPAPQPEVEAPRAPAKPPEAAPAKRQQTVLVVDDEQVLRDLISEILTNAGYKVIICSDGDEALEVYRNRADEIDAVLTDFAMPRMNGRELSVSLYSMNPKVRTILSSGYQREGLDEGNAPEEDRVNNNKAIRAFLPKPYAPSELIAVVRKVLNSGL